MSGHSKWSKIKRKKGANDAKRGALFTKLIRKITVAARDGGGDLDTNFALRLAVDQAKVENMPAANIDRAIKRGTGEIAGGKLEEVVYEAVFPDNFACMIRCTTDNKNRTVSEVRKAVEGLGGSFAAAGSISWQFDEKGIVTTFLEKEEESTKYGQGTIFTPVDPDEATLEILDIEGIEDISQIDIEHSHDGLLIVTSKDSFRSAGKALSDKHYRIDTMELGFLPKDAVTISEEKIAKISDTLEDLDDVDKVWGND